MFKITWSKKASEELDKLESLIISRIIKKISDLEENPYNLNIKKLKGIEGFRLRIGDYRVIFSIEQDTIFILKVGHRKHVYEN